MGGTLAKFGGGHESKPQQAPREHHSVAVQLQISDAVSRRGCTHEGPRSSGVCVTDAAARTRLRACAGGALCRTVQSWGPPRTTASSTRPKKTARGAVRRTPLQYLRPAARACACRAQSCALGPCTIYKINFQKHMNLILTARRDAVPGYGATAQGKLCVSAVSSRSQSRDCGCSGDGPPHFTGNSGVTGPPRRAEELSWKAMTELRGAASYGACATESHP